MAVKKYTINGKVVDKETGKSLPNHRIEAWSDKSKDSGPLGMAISNREGGFQISIDPAGFQKLEKGTTAEVYFKIYIGKRTVRNTENSMTWKTNEKKDVNIEIEAPGKISQGKDRINTPQILRAASFLSESDFSGVYDDFRQRASTTLGYISDMVMNSITELDLKPVKVKGPRMGDIVNKDVELVQKKLEDQNIVVEGIHPYNPKLNSESLNFSVLSSSLQEGQKVHLYQENGKVRYFSVVRDDERISSGGEKPGKENERIGKIQQELDEAKKVAAEKDKQILKLQEEIRAIKKDQSDIKTILRSDAFNQFLKNNPSSRPKK